MKWLRKMRPVLFALGLTLGIATLIGARSLTGTGPDGSAKPGDGAPRSASGPVVLGTVDTDPPPVDYRLPPVLPSGTVVKVHVKDGDEVRADQPLYEFDATMQRHGVKQAEAAVVYANAKVKEAEEGVKQHAANVSNAERAVTAAERNKDLTNRHYQLVETNLEMYYEKTEQVPKDKWPERKKSDPNLFKASVEYEKAVNDLSLAEQRRDTLKAVAPQVKVKEAEAAVEQAKAELAKAQSVVEMCVVKAKDAGIVEQVTISPGTTMGVATRAPALWLIPNGPRVVRAEIEAEFAHRVGPDIVGKTVTITDHTNTNLTYSGTVRRVPNVYLLKRASAENFLGGDTRVLEAVIEVSDPAPANKPPLRIGQRIRVNLGQ